jgi:iron complex outermembrane receptor protein
MRHSILVWSLAALAGIGIPLPAAYAQTESGFGLEEVVVTARKREESLQETPVAVSAFTGDDLELRQIASTNALSDVTPNMTFDAVSPSSGMNTSAQIYIRGIGQSDFTMVTDPGVGLYIDGVYMARSVGGVLDFLDTERIEVLRGPQGTLFGRNTIGGALLIHSRMPDDELHGNVEVEFGDDDKVFVTAHGNLPVNDMLKTGMSISRRMRDGYVTRVADGTDLGDDDTWGGRFVALFEPTETFTAHFAADYTHEDENGAPTVARDINDRQTFAAIANLIEPTCPVASLAPPARETNGNPNCANETSFIGEYHSGGTFPTLSELEAWGVALTLTWDVVDWLTVKSISSYRNTDAASSRDGDNTEFLIFQTMDEWEHEQVSQELQFSGKYFDDRLQWLLGLYYFQEDGTNINPVAFPVGAIQSGGSVDNDSTAAFLQMTYNVTEELAFTFGMRQTDDEKRFTPDQFVTGAFDPRIPINALPPPCRVPNTYCSSVGALPIGFRLVPFEEFHQDFDDVSFMGNVSYQWTETLMTYFTYSEGFKSGGYDQRFAAPPRDAATGENRPSDFSPETVKAYEIGFKSQWFGDTLRVNGAFFHTDYSDLQIIIRETFNPITFNGGDADIEGFELESVWVPADAWMVTAAVGYIDAEYVRLDDSVINNPTPVFEDNRLINTPKWSSSASVAYEFPFMNFGTLTPRLDWSFHDVQYNDAVNTPKLKQQAFHMLNAALTFRSSDEHWEGTLAFRNILDEAYLTTGNSAFATAASYMEAVYGRPFEWGVSVRYNFF